MELSKLIESMKTLSSPSVSEKTFTVGESPLGSEDYKLDGADWPGLSLAALGIVAIVLIIVASRFGR